MFLCLKWINRLLESFEPVRLLMSLSSPVQSSPGHMEEIMLIGFRQIFITISNQADEVFVMMAKCAPRDPLQHRNNHKGSTDLFAGVWCK